MEIELYNNLQNPIDAITALGSMFAKSGMFGCDRVEQGQVLAMVCLAERKSPTEITRTYDIIGGKLRKKAMAAHAEFRAKGAKIRWIKTGDDGIEARAEITFEGSTVVCSYGLAAAQKAGLVKDRSAWVTNPANMLRARVISNAIGMLAPEIYAGEEDGEFSQVAAPEIKLATPQPAPAPVERMASVVQAAAPAPEPVKAAPFIDVPTVPEPAPTPEPAPAAQVAPPAAQNLVNQVEEAIGEHGPVAVRWMIANGWLQAGQTLDALGEKKMLRIIKNRESFIRAITGGAQ